MSCENVDSLVLEVFEEAEEKAFGRPRDHTSRRGVGYKIVGEKDIGDERGVSIGLADFGISDLHGVLDLLIEVVDVKNATKLASRNE